MILETLEAVLMAAQDSLRVLGSADDPRVHEAKHTRDLLLSMEDFNAYVTAELMFRATEVHSIHLACDQDLARQLTVRFLPPVSTPVRFGSPSESAAEAFRIFNSIFQQSLSATTEWFSPTEDVFTFGPGEHHTQSSGSSFFHMALPAESGTLRVSVAIPSANENERRSHVDEDAPGRGEPITGDALQRVLSQSAEMNAVAQVDLPISEYKTDLHPARIVGIWKQNGREVLTLHVPSADRNMLDNKTSVLVSFTLRGRHYQFTSQTATVVERQLGPDAKLSLLAFDLPEQLKVDEQRRVFRVTPHPNTAVDVLPLYLNGGAEKNTGFHGVLKDISVLGAGVTSRDESIVDKVRQGRFVLCRFALPKEWGTVEVPSVVRYVRPYVVAGRREYRIGLKFLSNALWKAYEHGIETVCRYVCTRPVEGRRRQNESVCVPCNEVDEPGMDTSIALFSESFERCRKRPQFFRRFYELFLASSPEIQRKFVGTDFGKQGKMLETALVLLASLRTDPGVLNKLGEIADRHARHDLNIRPDMYDLWTEKLIETVAEMDPVFTRAIEQAWRTILAHGVAFMKKRY